MTKPHAFSTPLTEPANGTGPSEPIAECSLPRHCRAKRRICRQSDYIRLTPRPLTCTGSDRNPDRCRFLPWGPAMAIHLCYAPRSSASHKLLLARVLSGQEVWNRILRGDPPPPLPPLLSNQPAANPVDQRSLFRLVCLPRHSLDSPSGRFFFFLLLV